MDALRRPWLTALLLGSVATPAAVILAISAPVPLDGVLAWPLVLVDRWIAGTGETGPLARLAAGLLGIVLTWGHYILLARLLVRVIARRAADLS